jgi:hypothetical protein
VLSLLVIAQCRYSIGARKFCCECATPESVVRLIHTLLAAEARAISDMYFTHQSHDSLQQFVAKHVVVDKPGYGVFAQVKSL